MTRSEVNNGGSNGDLSVMANNVARMCWRRAAAGGRYLTVVVSRRNEIHPEREENISE